MQVYCDTDTLFHNVQRQSNEPKTRVEMHALQHLLNFRRQGRIRMVRSRVVLREIENFRDSGTNNASQLLDKLRADYESLDHVELDEKLHGFHHQSDPYGGFVTYPLMSDVQDEALVEELRQNGLKSRAEGQRDAEHLTQAACNRCDVFLTRDKGIIARRKYLSNRFPWMQVLQPSDLAKALGGDPTAPTPDGDVHSGPTHS
jgi:hypothetical protein